MIRRILIGLVLIVLILVVVVAMQPSEFRVTRSAVVDAPPHEVFVHVNDLHKWQEWSPWAKKDPDAKAAYEGPDAGKGAKFHWDGNREVGKGTMTIVESKPHELVRFQLDFQEPMAGTSTAEFTFKPEGDDKTAVVWTMTGENDFIGKAMCLVMDMDKMVGGEFEQGLSNLKSIVEKPSPDKKDSSPATPSSSETKKEAEAKSAPANIQRNEPPVQKTETAPTNSGAPKPQEKKDGAAKK